MCGICGLLSPKRSAEDLRTTVRFMAASLRHRGPDSSGIWVDEAGVGLGHARLSIIDLGESGRQPMTSRSGRWVVSYNGEIYNFVALRRELQSQGVPFRGTSDTEVLVNALDSWGVKDTLKRLDGMFALAAWDKDKRRLVLARDRLGQKPLFYGTFRGEFFFGSELRVLKSAGLRPEIDPESAALMLRYRGVPAPRTIYQGFYKLEPASYRIYELELGTVSKAHLYWNPWGLVHRKKAWSFKEAKEAVEREFRRAVKARLVSDVPLGAFLSGGVDSSLVVAAMQRTSGQRVKTFTVGFEDSSFNEAEQARGVAEFLDTEHTEMRLTTDEALEAVPKLATVYDEPFGDSSQLPTLLIAQLTRQHVTVALSGDGGDELFGGYNRHAILPRITQCLQLIPVPVRRALSKVLESPVTARILSQLQALGILPVPLIGDKLIKLAGVLKARDLQQSYRFLISDCHHPQLVIPGAYRGYVDEFEGQPHGLSTFEQLVLADFLLYLPEDILTKVDRATMAASLEARSPFLDHHLVELSLQLDSSFKIQSSGGKWILRDLLADWMPRELFERPKMGFAVPVADWLRTELRDWAESLLTSKWIGPDSLIDRRYLDTAWQQHQSGQRHRHHELWSILMLLSWLEENG